MDEARAQDNAEHSPYLRRIGDDAIGNGLTNGKHPSAWLLPFDRSPSRNVQDADFAVVQQRHASRVGQKTDLPFAYDAAQNDDSTRYSIPSYVLRDVARIAAEMTSQDVRGAGVEKRPAVVRTKSSCSSAQRRKSPAAVAPLHRFASHADKVRANSPTPNAVRNRSTERARPNATRQQSREPMVNRRPTVGAAAQTASATVTTCSRPVGPPAAACTKHQLQRKVHGGKTSERQTQQSNRSQTYSIKKPLPHKAVSSTPRLQKPGPRSYVNNVPQPPYICPSYGSLCESQWPDNDDDDDDSALALKPYAPRPERFVVSKPKSTASPRTPTPKPSVRQTKDDRTAAHDVDHGRAVRGADVCDNDDDGQLQLHVEVFPPPKARSSDDTETDQQRMMTAGTVRTSPSEHSLGSRHDIHEPQHNHMTEVDYAVRHVQTSTAAGQARPTENHHYQQQQPLITTDPMPSMSQLSVASCRPFRSRTRLQPPATVSMSTLVTETSRSVTKPVPVAPSGPVEHRRQSKIPRPTPAGIRPGVSVTASASKCSSVASLRSELNYARPMPVESIPFGKFGVECVVPLARQEVSATCVDAFSIAGVSGRRKRFLPLAESVAEGLWKTTGSTMEALSVATAQYDAGDDVCRVSIISSLVARPVANASTQTHKAVSLSPSPRRKKTESSRQETRDKAANKREKATADDDEDYAGMLVRLVQLMYLQTKLNASRSDNNNATVTQSKTHSQPRSHSNLMRTLHDYLQNHKQHAQSSTPNKSDGRPMQMNARSHSAEHGATVHRMGSPASQMYSKNDSRNNRANAVKAKNVYFDPKHRSPATASTNPTHDQRYHNYNRFSNISSYRTRVDSNSRPYSG